MDHADNADKLILRTTQQSTDAIVFKLRKHKDNPTHCESCGDEIPLARQNLDFKVLTCIPCAENSESLGRRGLR